MNQLEMHFDLTICDEKGSPLKVSDVEREQVQEILNSHMDELYSDISDWYSKRNRPILTLVKI